MNFFHLWFIHQVLPDLDVEHQIVDPGFCRDTVHHLIELLVDLLKCPLKLLLILGAPLLLHLSSACGFDGLLTSNGGANRSHTSSLRWYVDVRHRLLEHTLVLIIEERGARCWVEIKIQYFLSLIHILINLFINWILIVPEIRVTVGLHMTFIVATWSIKLGSIRS